MAMECDIPHTTRLVVAVSVVVDRPPGFTMTARVLGVLPLDHGSHLRRLEVELEQLAKELARFSIWLEQLVLTKLHQVLERGGPVLVEFECSHNNQYGLSERVSRKHNIHCLTHESCRQHSERHGLNAHYIGQHAQLHSRALMSRSPLRYILLTTTL